MNLRRFMEEALIVSPLVVLLAVGAQSRTAPIEFETYAYSDRAHNQILAYREPMLEVAKLKPNDYGQGSKEQTLHAVNAWIGAFDSGKISTLTSENALDTCRDGVKGQILASIQKLDFFLRYLAMEEPDMDVRLDYMESGLKLHMIYRYSDLYSIGIASGRQRNWLHLAESWIPSANPVQRSRISELTEFVASDPKKLGLVIARAERHYIQDGARWGERRIGVIETLFETAMTDSLSTQTVFAMASRAPGDTAFHKQTMGLQYAQYAIRSEGKLRKRIASALIR